MDKVLLVIDLQKEFYSDGKEQALLDYIDNNRDSYDKVIATVFVNDETINPNYFKALNYSGCTEVSCDSVEFDCDEVLLKSRYSVRMGELLKYRRCEIDVIGCDSDACVLATCFSLFDHGYDFRVLTDYIYSSSSNEGMNGSAISIMKRNFGIFVV